MPNKIILTIVGAIIILATAGFMFSETPQEQPQQSETAIAVSESARGGERELTMEATAYCEQKTSSSGFEPGPGMVAVDPEVIPIGTYLWIEGYGEAQALDTGVRIRGNVIDLWMPTEKECSEWGKRRVKVKMLCDQFGTPIP